MITYAAVKRFSTKFFIVIGAALVLSLTACCYMFYFIAGNTLWIPVLACFLLSIVMTSFSLILLVHGLIYNRFITGRADLLFNHEALWMDVWKKVPEVSATSTPVSDMVHKAVFRLIFGEEMLVSEEISVLKEAGFSANTRCFIALTITFLPANGIDNSDHLKWSAQLHELIGKSIESWMPEGAHARSTVYEDLVAVLIGFDNVDLDELGSVEIIMMEVTTAAEATVTAVKASCGHDISITIGEPQSIVAYIYCSFATAMDVMDYLRRNKIQRPVCSIFDTDRFNKKTHHRLVTLDTQFYYLLINSKPDKALEIILDIIDVEANSLAYSLSIVKQFTRDKFNTLMRVIGYTNYSLHGLPEDFWKTSIRQINAAQTIDMLKDNILQMVGVFSDNFIRYADTTKFKVDDQINYIRSNFTNPELNAEMVARHFNVTPSYLSRLFKQELGIGVLENIHLRRIEAAKEYLVFDMKIEEIAKLCGYYNRRALDSVFKRYTGISPSEFRRSMIEDSLQPNKDLHTCLPI